MRTVFDYILALLIFLLLSWICFVCFSACLKQNVAQGILKNAAGLLRFAPSLKLIDLRTLL
ncbi:hypothetical protein BDW22DRAFT_1185558 [Trametopsis cervina]|nr:hypothetical protein BDW22DRAFT_1185558 [Trametopsis cervina]